MAFNYASLQNVARKLILQFGRPATLRHRAQVVDPATGQSVPTIEDLSVTVVVSDARYDPQDPNSKIGDKQILIAELGSRRIDETRDRLIVGSEIYRIVSSSEISPGASVVLWQVRARRGE